MSDAPRKPGSPAVTLLSASAIALLVFILVQWSRLPGGTPAFAEMVASGSDVAIMTSDGGSNDIVVVLDQRAEELLVYQPQNGKSLQFHGRYPLRDLFAEGRILGGTSTTPSRPSPDTTPPTPANPSR